MSYRLVEKRIRALENQVAANKAIYPVAGSLVETVAQVSGAYSRTGGNLEGIEVEIEFEPDIISASGLHLTRIIPEVFIDAAMTQRWPRYYFANQPQSGNNVVRASLNIATVYVSSTYYFRFTAVGGSTGTFDIV